MEFRNGCIICFALLVFIVSCSNQKTKDVFKQNQKSIKQQISVALTEKYQEKFSVSEVYFEKGLNLYQFTASPKSEAKIQFEGQFDERNSVVKDQIIHDAYPNMKFSYEAAKFYDGLFPNRTLKLVASASVNSMYKHQYGTKVPSLDDQLKNRKTGSTIRMNTYFFEVPNNAYHQTVVTIRAVLEELHAKYGNNYSLYVGFWPEGFLEGKKLEELSFGFEATSQNDADNLLNKMQYLSKVLFIKITSGAIDSLDEEQLFELIKDYNKNGLDEMVEI